MFLSKCITFIIFEANSRFASPGKNRDRMLLRLLQYDIVVKYTKRKEMHIADTLSRAYLADGADSCEQFSQINAVEHLPIGNLP